MVDFHAFADELIKISDAGMISIPSIQRLPRDADEALESIKNRIDRHGVDVLGHKNIAVPVKRLGDLTDLGFKKTRIAVPLPGERIGRASWRRGQLHAHELGDKYVMHKDKTAPTGVIAAISHAIKEGLPAAKKRLSDGQATLVL